MSASPCSSSRVPWSPPQVLIDNDDSRIKYTGNWFIGPGVSTGDWGGSLGDSTHQLRLSNVSAGFSFNFTGTAVNLLGDLFSYSSDVSGARLEIDSMCLIDGQQKGGSGAGSHLLCGIENLPDGEHEISYTIRSTNISSPLVLYLDAIQYLSSSTDAIDGENTLMVDACDSSIDFGQDVNNWTPFNSSLSTVLLGLPLGFRDRYKGIQTNTPGTQLQYNFTGTRIQWMTTVLSPQDGGSLATKVSHATFIVDNSPDMNYTIDLPWYSNDTRYNQLVFQTPEPLSPGEHTLFVEYLGDHDSLPLTLSYFYIYDGVEVSPVGKSGIHLAPILGGSLGGFFGLLLVLIVGWVTYHRRQRVMEKRAWDIVWQKRQQQRQQSEALEMSPRPEKA